MQRVPISSVPLMAPDEKRTNFFYVPFLKAADGLWLDNIADRIRRN